VPQRLSSRPNINMSASFFARVFCLGLAILAGAAQATPPTLGSDEAAVVQAAGLSQRDGAYYLKGCAAAFKPDTERLDVNRDGRDEIVLLLGPSRCFDESAGGNLALFTQGADGSWRELLGFFPGVELVPLERATQGFTDLGLVNPGGCMAVFRWNGTAYVVAGNRAIEPGGCQFR
jgi:hypothetical protein